MVDCPCSSVDAERTVSTRLVAGSNPAGGASPELEGAVIRSRTRQAVSTDMKAAWLVVRPLLI